MVGAALSKSEEERGEVARVAAQNAVVVKVAELLNLGLQTGVVKVVSAPTGDVFDDMLRNPGQRFALVGHEAGLLISPSHTLGIWLLILASIVKPDGLVLKNEPSILSRRERAFVAISAVCEGELNHQPPCALSPEMEQRICPAALTDVHLEIARDDLMQEPEEADEV